MKGGGRRQREGDELIALTTEKHNNGRQLKHNKEYETENTHSDMKDSIC